MTVPPRATTGGARLTETLAQGADDCGAVSVGVGSARVNTAAMKIAHLIEILDIVRSFLNLTGLFVCEVFVIEAFVIAPDDAVWCAEMWPGWKSCSAAFHPDPVYALAHLRWRRRCVLSST